MNLLNTPITYPYALVAILFALCVYVYAMIRVLISRAQHQIPAPKTTGHPEFERVFRAQQNTVEQFPIFLALFVILAWLWGDIAAAVYGGIWSVGRILFINGYAQSTDKRRIGFLMSAGLSLLALTLIIFALLIHFL